MLCLFVSPSPIPLATADPFTVPICLPFPECHRVLWNPTVCLLSRLALSFVCFHGLRACFSLVLSNIPSSGWTAAYLSLRQLKDCVLSWYFRSVNTSRMCYLFTVWVQNHCTSPCGPFLWEKQWAVSETSGQEASPAYFSSSSGKALLVQWVKWQNVNKEAGSNLCWCVWLPHSPAWIHLSFHLLDRW